MRYGFVIDQRKCIGCHACTVACKEENQVPLGVNRTWVKYIEKGTFPDTRRYFSVMRCNHCDNAPCVTICPTVALYRRPDGIVDFDGDRCIGCKSCMQACPYDALYIDPETQTAAKCHYCAHRVEVALEPACVIVCPVQAIIPGDLDDPNSRIARLMASQQVSVRKPELGTQPKLFYLGADEASLTPAMQERGGRYAFAEGSRIPMPGRSNVAGAAPATSSGHEGVDLLRMARTVYDVAHAERPWGWKVSTYLWTKSVAAGSLLVAALAVIGGLPSAGTLAGLAAPLISLIFLALTTGLLVLDLKRPERFLYLLFKPNGRSWLVWGGWILMVHGILAILWLGAGWAQSDRSLIILALPMLITAAASAGYSAFLFGQAEGRDFWQSPLVLPDLLVSACLAGSASILVTSRLLGVLVDFPRGPAVGIHTAAQLGDADLALASFFVLGASLVLHGLLVFAELVGSHSTEDARRAARWLARGPCRGRFAGGVVFGGIALPLALLFIPWPSAWALGAVLALGGLWLWEDLWVRAGQALPLS
ncbi:MAG TPA: 4Fe-4S dicluster domain-containing protein [Methylomirabilota bacterium]|jgi:Fe-S-cluster-containing dehydrogenase component/formate-dependent nitrite reductase membrane component NrfD|nr:4Fe-4S dicluster domain-containing protein [Methylomirabilota bacterium]